MSKRRKFSASAYPEIIAFGKSPAGDVDTSEDDDEDALPVARPARQRVRAGFIVDSSEEE